MDRVVNGLFALAFGLMALTWTLEPFTTIQLVLAYLLIAVIACNQYDQRMNHDISLFFSFQVTIVFGLGIVLLALSLGGLGIRTFELVVVFSLVLVFVLARNDLPAFVQTNLPYLLAFAFVFGVFLYHSTEFPSGSSLGLFPVYAGFILALNLFFFPHYVVDDTVLWSVAAVAGFFSLLGLIAAVYGEFTWWLFEVRTWSGNVTPEFIDRDVSVTQSAFANPNTLGVLLFAGTVTATAAIVRTLRSRWPVLAIVPGGLLALNGLGLYATNSRASMFAAVVAVGLYLVSATDRRLLPVAAVGAGVVIPAVLLSIYMGLVPIDPANRFDLWRAGVEAVRADGSWLGQGIISTRDAIDPFIEGDNPSVHNSYLSMFIRIGFLGGLAYLVLVLGPLVHGLVRYDRVNVAMFALAVGFAAHQLFEAYTLYQFGPGSIVGALALGYVISSLGPGDRRPAATAEAGTNAKAEEDGSSSDAWPGVEPLGNLRNRYGTDTDRRDERP